MSCVLRMDLCFNFRDKGEDHSRGENDLRLKDKHHRKVKIKIEKVQSEVISFFFLSPFKRETVLFWKTAFVSQTSQGERRLWRAAGRVSERALSSPRVVLSPPQPQGPFPAKQ